MSLRIQITLPIICSVLISGCSSPPDGPPRLKTTPVTGVIHVDGTPAVALTVECHPQEGADTIKHPVSAMTDAEGKFSVGMYEAGDGLPQGTYKLTFMWTEMMTRRDKLNGAYDSPKTSTIEANVVTGSPTDLGVIELSTKSPEKKLSP